MIPTRKENDEVLYPQEAVFALGVEDLEALKRLALLNPRKRVRLCAHPSPVAPVHEMFIVHAKVCYVRPHLHVGKMESTMILDGDVDVVLFHEDGRIKQVVPMGPLGSGKPFFLNLPERVYHTLIIRSDLLVFHECTEGPFVRENTVFPSWAPEENHPDSLAFLEKLDRLIRAWNDAHEK